MTPRPQCCRAWDAAIERALAIVRGKPDAEYVEALRGRCNHGGACSCVVGKAAHCNAHGYETMERR